VEWTELSHIRYPAPDKQELSLNPQSKVEAFLPHHDNENPGWWTGVLVKTKGEVCRLCHHGSPVAQCMLCVIMVPL